MKTNKKERPNFTEPAAKTVLISASPLEIQIFGILKKLPGQAGGSQSPVFWPITASDIRRKLPREFQSSGVVAIRRGLKRLEELGLIKSTELGYNRRGFAVTRTDI